MQCSSNSFLLLSDAQRAYDAHLKNYNDGTEKRAWTKLRSSKLLETRLKEAGYELRVMGKLEAIQFNQTAAANTAEGDEQQEEQNFLSQPGAAAAATAPSARGGRGNWRGSNAGGESAFLILHRRWRVHGSGIDDQPSAAAAVANVMDGALPSTDGAFISKQLAGMFSFLGGHFNTWNDAEFPFLGGALAKLVYYLQEERKRDLNPAAAAADEALEYRPRPAVHVQIEAAAPVRKRVRGSVHSL